MNMVYLAEISRDTRICSISEIGFAVETTNVENGLWFEVSYSITKISFAKFRIFYTNGFTDIRKVFVRYLDNWSYDVLLKGFDFRISFIQVFFSNSKKRIFGIFYEFLLNFAKNLKNVFFNPFHIFCYLFFSLLF